jgi:phenylacetate-CoA ligase
VGIKQQILKYAPIWLQNMLISYYGQCLIKQRYGQTYFDQRNVFVNKLLTDFTTLKTEQNELLKTFLKQAVRSSAFYQQLYKDIDLDLIQTVDDLSLLPIVDKELLRQNIDSVYTLAEKDGINSFTGGTTGTSLQVRFTHDDFQCRMAYLDAFKMRLGIDPFLARKATFSGREFTRGWASDRSQIFWRDNRAYKQRLYSTFDMTEKNLPRYIEDLNRYQPTVLNGFVSAIYELAHFIKRQDMALSFQVDAVFTTSESLLPHHKSLIEEVFNTRVYDQYSSAEGAPFITECMEGSLHYGMDTGVIETISSEAGDEMLITAFFTHGTPLIRYRIGDMIQFKPGKCACGSAFPLVAEIQGRKVDYLYSPQYGNVSLSHLADVIKGLPNCVSKVQFHQHIKTEIIIWLQVDMTLFDQAAKHKILQAMIYRFGENMIFSIELKDDIPKEKSGKYALIKNRLQRADNESK